MTQRDKKNNLQSSTSLDGRRAIIFTKKINTQYKLVPFNIVENHVGKTKYLPAVSKEWKNSVYNYSPKNNINFPVYDLNINSLIRGYFSLYFNNKFLQHKYISRRKKRKSLTRIFVSKAEIKHTNEKAIITLYVYNRERFVLLKKIRKLQKFWGSNVKKKISFLADKWWNLLSLFTEQSSSKELESIKYNNNYLSLLPRLKFRFDRNNLQINSRFYARNKRFFKQVKEIFSTIRRLRLRLSLNKYKFEDKFIFKLSQLISQYYGKKVEFNIVNLRSVAYNSDIFTEILTLKLRKNKSTPMGRMNSLLSRIHLPKVNNIIERGRLEKTVDFELINNKYKNLNINYILGKEASAQGSSNEDNLNKLLYNIYYKTILTNSVLPDSQGGEASSDPAGNSSRGAKSLIPLGSEAGVASSNKWGYQVNKAYFLKLRDIIFENIKYKAMGGARLIVKGRLTKRYRADRALYKLKWKGGLKNIDSSFKGLTTVHHLGYQDSNVTKSSMVSKRKIGSFGVRAWISGKN